MASALRGLLGGLFIGGKINQALMLLIDRRLGEIPARIARLAARFAAGLIRPQEPRSRAAETRADTGAETGAETGAAPGTEPGATSAKALTYPRPAPIWPRRSAWLVRWCGYHAAGYGLQFQHLLGHPDMVALLVACPQAGRILLPMCRMLGVDTALLRPRPDGSVAPAPVPVVKAKKKRVRPKLPPIDWGRIPLPRGMLSAARRAGFKPVR